MFRETQTKTKAPKLARAAGAFFLALAAFGASGSPRVIVPEPSYDFGTIEQGAKVSHTFVIRNEGNASLTITRMALTLPGMKVTVSPSIPPGGEGKVTLEWDTGLAQSKVEGRVAVFTSDPAAPTVMLEVSANVVPRIEFRPVAAAILTLYKGESAERRIEIINHQAEPLVIQGLKPEGHNFVATLTTLEPGKVYALDVKVPPTVPPGRYQESVLLDTHPPGSAPLRIPVLILVRNDVYVWPGPAVNFGRVPIESLRKDSKMLALLTQTLLVKKREGRDFRLTKVETDLPMIDIRQSPLAGASPTFRLDVALDPAHLKPGKIQGNIRIETNDKKFPSLVVPVSGELF